MAQTVFAPITPIIDTPTGRLAELVHLLADVPFDEALEQVDSSPETALDDPLWTVAGAIVRLRPGSTKPSQDRPTATVTLLPV